MATAPLSVLLYDRTFLAGTFRLAIAARWGLYLALAATWGLIAWIFAATRFHGGTTGFAVQEFTAWSYLLTQPGVLVHYLRLAFWPAGLCLDYGWPPAETINQIVWPGVLILGLLGLTAWVLWSARHLGFWERRFF